MHYIIFLIKNYNTYVISWFTISIILFKLALSVHLKVWKVHLKITIVLNVILDPLKLKKYFVIFYTTGNLS